MRLADALSGVQRVALDSSALIRFQEEDPQTIGVLRPIFERIDDGRLVACGSVLLRTETLVYARAQSDMADPLPIYRERLARMELSPVTNEVADIAVELRMDYRLASMDALHLASAVVGGCDLFLNADADFTFQRAGQRLTCHDGRSIRIIDARDLTR